MMTTNRKKRIVNVAAMEQQCLVSPDIVLTCRPEATMRWRCNRCGYTGSYMTGRPKTKEGRIWNPNNENLRNGEGGCQHPYHPFRRCHPDHPNKSRLVN